MAKDDLSEEPTIVEVHDKIKFDVMKVIVETISSTSSKLIIQEFERTLDDKQIVSNIKNNIMPYLYTAGLLSFAGREINEKNMSSVLSGVGIEPNPAMIQIVLNTGIKSHLVYIYAFYFLIANGIKVSEENILSIIRALGLPPDRERVIAVLKFTSLPNLL